MKGDEKKPVFLFTDDQDRIVYTLSDSTPEDLRFQGILAIGFKDMNGDDMKDILIINEYTELNKNSGPKSTARAAVYFSQEKSYTVLPWYNDVLSDSVKNLTIANLEKKGTEILKRIQSSNYPLIICTPQLQQSGGWDYASPSDSVILFLNEGNTFSESYIASCYCRTFGRGEKFGVGIQGLASK
ncbi:hypothetical protein [Paenibacillus sanfengchensis]|uniref:hypothetical protein n=1 Tax=Paenibacillus sanfengchensis TaxID=3119819 RepID=UPI002FDF1AE2